MIFKNQYSYVLKLFFNLLLPNGTIWCRIAKNFDFKIRKHQGKNFLIAPRLWVGCPLEFISSDISQNLTENVSGSNGLGYWSIFGSACIWSRYFHQIWKVISILKNIRDSNRSHQSRSQPLCGCAWPVKPSVYAPCRVFVDIGVRLWLDFYYIFGAFFSVFCKVILLIETKIKFNFYITFANLK